MNKLHIQYRTTIPALLMALTLACLCSQIAQGAGKGGSGGGGAQGGSIVGLWDVTYTSDNPNNPMSPFETYQQWHSDGLEIESPSFSLGECMGTWKQMASNMVQLFHVGWTVGSPPGTVRFVLTETITVGADGNSFDGTYDQKFYDADGNLALEDTGTTHATRISVN